MPAWRNSVLGSDATTLDAIGVIRNGGFEIAVVTDGDDRLAGTITDGDVRRALLRGLDFETPAAEIMNAAPLTAGEDTDREWIKDQMLTRKLRQIPLVDAEKRIVGLAHLRDFTAGDDGRDNRVVLMAGGLGERLRPLTNATPKPLLSIGDKPLLQRILESFIAEDFRHFYMSVNYKAETIKDMFGDGARWDADIRYLEEDRKLGTAGALQLIKERPDAPLIVMNGDLITKVSFRDILDYHNQQEAAATMCVREYDLQVPFGVVDLDGNEIRAIDEKPVHRFFVNAGIYVINPDVIDLIPEGAYKDMTELFDTLIANGKKVTAFPIHEYWLDIGRADDLKRANLDFQNGTGT
ncbi:MAG: nucleotidyltransferase family protein [Rhodospirillales bacterium]|nr:nucleotidyltransferase family protein [Rhodospirillales bacterium]